jgi:hypothetical protein
MSLHLRLDVSASPVAASWLFLSHETAGSAAVGRFGFSRTVCATTALHRDKDGVLLTLDLTSESRRVVLGLGFRGTCGCQQGDLGRELSNLPMHFGEPGDHLEDPPLFADGDGR